MSSTAETLRLLGTYESRNVTFVDPGGAWPIVWQRARGCHVWDAEGRRYLDLTAAFGVAAAGHANARVVRAGQRQMAMLLHAMGDVHPHALKAELARKLSEITFGRWGGMTGSGSRNAGHRPAGDASRGKVILASSGFEAVEAALKTALLATGRPRVLAFEGAYHGLGYGALNATHRDHFRSPFRRQLREFARFAPFPEPDTGLDRLATGIRRRLADGRVGAVLVEPVQARGGIRVPPAGFLTVLRRLCDEHGALLILDEIYTGFGRTGRWFACEHDGVVPDLICLGKALAGGFPISACVGRAELMDRAWPESDGEAIHTSTFLGHPVGCAMALAQIQEIDRLDLVGRSARLGAVLLQELGALAASPAPGRRRVRGLGLMAGIELCRSGGAPATAEALRAVQAMLGRGFILLPEGAAGNVIGFTPPLTLPARELRRTVAALGKVLQALGTV